ncbi:N-alpha-acetyltransferase 38, NatC auxiliary subunit [Carex littledalei]|uniref:U6 snRNA-associated Sm-like protein LSm8 n=1 Tax=Carex littledalei TaxID=544730 RepID=A0A833RIJ0_9POAL|nr:N-alpha-acetyltransferase 38, NatC auxiliary subunit [Carex littledalei]
MTEVSREERRGGGEIGFWAGRQRGGRVWSLAAINLEQRIGLASGEERPAFCLLRSSAERKGGATTPSSLLPLSPQLHLPPPSPSPSHQFAYRNPCRLRPKPHPDLVREMFQPEKGSEVSPLVESPSPAMEGKLGSRHSLLIGEFSSVATFKHFQGTALAMVQTEMIQHYNYKGLPGVTVNKEELIGSGEQYFCVSSNVYWMLHCFLSCADVISVITNDGRNIVGVLKGFDQATNIILDESHERVYSTKEGVQQLVLGLYIIRGDNISVVGELDEDLDANLDLSKVRAHPLKPVIH